MTARHQRDTILPMNDAATTLVYGFHPVRQLLRHRPHAVRRMRIAAARGRRRDEIETLCRRHQVAFETVPERELRAVGGLAVHNGFVADAEAELATTGGGDQELLVVAEDVQDPRNLGALLRVCECTGVGRVLVRDRGSTPVTAAVAKTAAGATEWLEVERITNTANALEQLKKEGYWIFGAAGEGETVWDVDLTGKAVLVIGGEAKGLRARTRALCDRLVALPLLGRIESLNLATAASALLYEAIRQRRNELGSSRC